MMLTTKGRYAVMAMVDLAINSKNNRPFQLEKIANNQEITVAYLEQIFAKLKKANLVKSVRGPGGGYVLADEAKNIDISKIIKAVDENIKITRCSSHKPCLANNNSKKCYTHNLWAGLNRTIESYMQNVTIDDICQGNLRAG